MRSSESRIAALALVLLLTAATSTRAVVIFFKDGSQELVAESYRVDGDRLIASLPSGQETAIPLSAVDLERTEAMSKVVKGSAIVIDHGEVKGEIAPAKERTLKDLMHDRNVGVTGTDHSAATAPVERRTVAGNTDLFSVPRRPVAPPDRGEEIVALLERKGLNDVAVSQGTSSHRVLITIVTDTRAEVFSALQACAAALHDMRTSMPNVEALELAMQTATHSRAGMFVLTPDQAERLRNGEVTPAEHFVANVLF